MSTSTFTCNLENTGKYFPHFWEHTIGSGHAQLALRADWQKQLARSAKELGFKYARFHAILSDDMGTLVNENNELVYSFFNADQIFDFLLSIGMKPFVELSFMPLALASGPETVFNYKANITRPRDYNEWETFIEKIVQHWMHRYGAHEVKQWFFEIWNEPNLKAFWTGKQADYFNLYKHTVTAVKRVHPDLKVGGPATAKNEWIKDFIDYCTETKIPADFISTHHYPTDAFGKPGDNTKEQLAASKRSILREQAIKVKKQAGDKPVYYTEWSTSSNPFDELHDLPYAAAFITKTIMEAQGLVEAYSYWTFSDIFDENYFSSMPFHGGFGLLNIYGIPKPAYRAYELMHRLGNHTLPVKGDHDTVDVWAFEKEGAIQFLITNSALPHHPVKTELISIELITELTITSSYIEKIDEAHANATQAWYDMGKPGSLSEKEVKVLEKASALIKLPVEMEVKNKRVIIQVSIPPQGVACITLLTEENKI